MISEVITFDAAILFAGFGLGFFIGYLVSLIKYIITAFSNWIRS